MASRSLCTYLTRQQERLHLRSPSIFGIFILLAFCCSPRLPRIASRYSRLPLAPTTGFPTCCSTSWAEASRYFPCCWLSVPFEKRCRRRGPTQTRRECSPRRAVRCRQARASLKMVDSLRDVLGCFQVRRGMGLFWRGNAPLLSVHHRQGVAVPPPALCLNPAACF